MISEIESLKAQNELANKALIEIAIQLGFDHFADGEVAIAIESLLVTKATYAVKIEERDREIVELQKAESMYLGIIQNRDRKIATLEVNLDRATADHVEQLRAVEQMLIVLKSNDLGEGGAYTVGEMKLAIAVIQNNIKRLDP